MDLEALVTDELREEIAGYQLEWFDVEASSRRPPHATVGVRTPDGEEVDRLVHRRRPGRRDLPRDQRRHRQRRAGCASSASTPSPAARTRSARRRSCSRSAASPARARASRPTSSRPAARAYVRALSNALSPRGRSPTEAEARWPTRPSGASSGAVARSRGRRRAERAVPAGRRPRARGRCGSRSMKLVPIAAAALGVRARRVWTAAPRRRSASASTDTAERGDGADHARARCWVPARLAVGFRHSTWVSRPAGAASRLVGLQTPPSTYSRPPISTGANSHGHRARGLDRLGDGRRRARRGLPNTTRRPVRRSTAATRRRPSKRAPEPLDPARRRSRSSWRAGQPAQQRRAHHRAAGRGEAERQRRERGAGGHRPRAGAPGRVQRRRGQARRPARGRPRRRRARCSIDDGRRGDWPAARCAATIEPAEVPTKYSHSRRSKPVASSIPASTPIIHASPRTPPPPSTSTSGGVSMAIARLRCAAAGGCAGARLRT